jgi:hypothetical protein
MGDDQMSEVRYPQIPSDPEEPLDLSDERHVRQRSRNVKARENTQAQVLRNLMASIDGREWMYELLALCHVYQTSFSADALWMAKAEGERTIGLQLIGQIQVSCPEAYLQMMKEAAERADVRA